MTTSESPRFNNDFNLSEKQVNAWWKWLDQFSNLGNIWSSQGWGTKEILPPVKQIIDASSPAPQIKGEQTAILIPIADRDWSIKLARFGDAAVNHGALWACQSAFAVIDLQEQEIHSVPYKTITGIERVNDILKITTDEALLELQLKIPRPSETMLNFKFVLALIQIAFSQSPADREAAGQGNERECANYYHRLQWAESFVEGLYTFFCEASNKGGAPVP